MRKETLILLITLLSLASIQLLRGNTFYPLYPTAYETLEESGMGFNFENGVPTALSLFLGLFSEPLRVNILFWMGIFCSIALPLLAWKLLEPLPEKQRFLAVILFSASPSALYLAYSAESIGFSLAILGYLLLSTTRVWGILNVLIAVSIQPLHALVALPYTTFFKRDLVSSVSILLGSALVLAPRMMANALPSYNLFTFGNFLSDLRGIGGISTLLFIVGLFGIFNRNIDRRWIAPLVFLFIPSPIAWAYVTLLLAISAAYTLAWLNERRWTIESLHALTLAIIGCGIVFSTLSYAVVLRDALPTDDYVRVLEDIEKRTTPEDHIFSSAENAPYLAVFTHRKAVFPLSYRGANAPELLNTSLMLLSSYNLPLVQEQFIAWNVSAVFITPTMTSGGVWDRPDEGLHYLLKNQEVFEPVYNDAGYGLWRVKSNS